MAEAAHHYKFDITMTCSGCSGAVERVLKKTEGLSATLISAAHTPQPTLRNPYPAVTAPLPLHAC